MEIPNELKSFKETVSSSIDNMNSVAASLSDKLETVKNATSTVQSGVDTYYKSKNKSEVLGSILEIRNTNDTLSISISSQLQGMLASSKNLINKITNLEGYITTYEEQERVIAAENRKETPNTGVIYSANAKKNEAKTNFDRELPEAVNDLAALKSMDSNVITTTSVDTSDAGTDFVGLSMDDLKNLTPGSYTEHSYIGSNGMEVKYWIYVPENINDVEGLPVTAYMCGGCERGNNVNGNSLPMYVKNGDVKPEGIVITLRTEQNEDYTKPAYLTTCKEIIDNVVTTFKADTDRISLSGHSNGGRGVLALAGRYPDYFSVVVPVCGFSNGIRTAVDSKTSNEVLDNLTKTHIVALSGSNDTNSKSSMNSLYQLLKNGGNMSLEIPKGYDHTTTFHKYYEPVEIEGKQYNSLLDYLFTYKKA